MRRDSCSSVSACAVINNNSSFRVRLPVVENRAIQPGIRTIDYQQGADLAPSRTNLNLGLFGLFETRNISVGRFFCLSWPLSRLGICRVVFSSTYRRGFNYPGILPAEHKWNLLDEEVLMNSGPNISATTATIEFLLSLFAIWVLKSEAGISKVEGHSAKRW